MDKESRQQMREEIEQKIDYWLPMTQRYEALQVALLFRILDTLESIDASLQTMSDDSWNDHHNH